MPEASERTESFEPFVVGKLGTTRQVRRNMASIVRKVASGSMDTVTGKDFIKMLEGVLKALHQDREFYYKDKQLEMMAGGEAVAVFQGFIIQPPADRMGKVIDVKAMDVQEGLQIKPPKRKGT